MGGGVPVSVPRNKIIRKGMIVVFNYHMTTKFHVKNYPMKNLHCTKLLVKIIMQKYFHNQITVPRAYPAMKRQEGMNLHSTPIDSL